MNPFGYLVIALGILVVILISLTLSRIKDRKIITGSLHGYADYDCVTYSCCIAAGFLQFKYL